MIKKVIIAIAIVLVVAGLVTGGLVLLKGGSAQPEPKTVPLVLTATETISQLSSADLTATLGSGVVVTETDNKTTQFMYVQDKESQKYVQVSSSSWLSFRKAGGFASTDVTTLKKAVSDFLTTRDFSDLKAQATSQVLSSYANPQTSCQLSSLVAEKPLEIQFICRDDYGTDVSKVRELLTLWPDETSTSYSLVTSKSLTETDTTVAILDVSTADFKTTESLIFVKKGTTWTYIGNASKGPAVESNERYVINADLKKGLDNPTYGSVLRKALSTL